MRDGGAKHVVRIYHPWPTPVQAACFRETSALQDIAAWVATLRDHGRVTPDVGFTIRRNGDALTGVLHDRAGDHELPPGAFLVFGGDGLTVLDERSFLRRYRDPDAASS